MVHVYIYQTYPSAHIFVRVVLLSRFTIRSSVAGAAQSFQIFLSAPLQFKDPGPCLNDSGALIMASVREATQTSLDPCSQHFAHARLKTPHFEKSRCFIKYIQS